MDDFIYLIVQRQSETYGHGDCGESWKLPTTGAYDSGNFHPAFKKENEAIDYINDFLKEKGLVMSRMQIVKIDLR